MTKKNNTQSHMKKYVKEKISVLRDLCVKLSADDKRHLRSLKTEIAVDNFARDLIKRERNIL